MPSAEDRVSARLPRVSVVVPVYNRAAYIEASIRSVLAQNFVAFEVIVVDDGSTDDSFARASGIGDSRVVCHRQTNSGGPAAPRNVGISLARGEYVAFLDSDDLWLPDKLERQVQSLDARPDAGMAFNLATYFDDTGALGLRAPKVAHVPEALFASLLLDGNFLPTSSVIVRRDVLARTGGFDEAARFRAVEDFDLWLRIAHAQPVLFLPHVLSQHRVHAGNISQDRRAMVHKVRAVIEANCARFAVARALHDQALSRSYLEELKAELEYGSSPELARVAVDRALALDPHNRAARALEGLLKVGLFQPLQIAYRNRGRLTHARDLLNRVSWLRR